MTHPNVKYLLSWEAPQEGSVGDLSPCETSENSHGKTLEF